MIGLFMYSWQYSLHSSQQVSTTDWITRVDLLTMQFRAKISLRPRFLLFLFVLSIPLTTMGYQSHSSTIAIAEESEIVAVIKPEAKSLSIISTKDWSTIKIINLNSAIDRYRLQTRQCGCLNSESFQFDLIKPLWLYLHQLQSFLLEMRIYFQCVLWPNTRYFLHKIYCQ